MTGKHLKLLCNLQIVAILFPYPLSYSYILVVTIIITKIKQQQMFISSFFYQTWGIIPAGGNDGIKAIQSNAWSILYWCIVSVPEGHAEIASICLNAFSM